MSKRIIVYGDYNKAKCSCNCEFAFDKEDIKDGKVTCPQCDEACTPIKTKSEVK